MGVDGKGFGDAMAFFAYGLFVVFGALVVLLVSIPIVIVNGATAWWFLASPIGGGILGYVAARKLLGD